jgi:hypothetical protein
VEVLGQLNPSVMVDLDLDTQDFGRLGSLSTLFRTVGETLLHGNRQARVQCLQELAQQAPQALCSVALHVPFDVLVRELDGVIYDSVGAEGKLGAALKHADLSERDRSSVPMDGAGGAKAGVRRDHSWHGDNMRVSPASPRLADPSQAHGSSSGSLPRKNSVMSALYRAGNMLGRRRDLEDGGVGWEAGGGSNHSLDSAPEHGDADDDVTFDRTWHGTKVTREQMQSGSYEYSEVPRHGALRLPPSKPYTMEGCALVPRAGMLDALQLLSGVLGREFLINFTMPCLKHKDSDKVQLARLIGQLHYSATTAGCLDAAADLRDMHISMLKSGDELQQINSIKSLPDFARHDSDAVASHLEDCSKLLVEILCDNAGSMAESTRLHLLESYVYAVPSFVRRLDADILQNEIGVSGGTPLTHQIQHPKTLQGLDHRRISHALHDCVCKLIETATRARQAKWLADGVTSAAPGSLPPIPAPPDRDDILSSGLWNVSQTTEAKTKRTLEERYVDAGLAVVRMCHGDVDKKKTPKQIQQITRSMGPWRVMVECKFIHRALVSGLAALSRQLMVGISPGQWEPAPAIAQDVLIMILTECTGKPFDLQWHEKGKLCVWSWMQQIEGGTQAVKFHCQLPIILTAISRDWADRKFWTAAMQAAYNGYLASRRVELIDGTWSISEDGLQVENAFSCCQNMFSCCQSVFSAVSMCSRAVARVLLPLNVFSYYRTRSLTMPMNGRLTGGDSRGAEII